MALALKLTAAFGMLLGIFVLGACGLVVLNWEWAGLGAGAAGFALSTILLWRTRVAGFAVPLGGFAGLTLMQTWLLWSLRDRQDFVDSLVFMGIGAIWLGLAFGVAAAIVLSGRIDRSHHTDTATSG